MEGPVRRFDLNPKAHHGLRLRTRSLVVIPARLESTRLPQKMLLAETGRPLIQHTYEAACHAQRPLGVTVATDHERILSAVHAFQGQAELTSPAARSGTDRVAEIAARMPQIDIFVNLQGDEPEMPGQAIDQVIELLEAHPAAVAATLATPIRSRGQLNNPACVKVVSDHEGRALYFSRSAIPHAREWRDEWLTADPPVFFQHLGLYAYRRDFLLRLAQLPPSPLEQLESLEQLRLLSAGHIIQVGNIEHPAKGIDTWDDYRAFVSRCAGC